MGMVLLTQTKPLTLLLLHLVRLRLLQLILFGQQCRQTSPGLTATYEYELHPMPLQIQTGMVLKAMVK